VQALFLVLRMPQVPPSMPYFDHIESTVNIALAIKLKKNQHCPHAINETLVITQQLNLKGLAGTGAALAVSGTRSIMVCPCLTYFLLLLQAFSFCWLIYLLKYHYIESDKLPR
jgi:hypothetical protein